MCHFDSFFLPLQYIFKVSETLSSVKVLIESSCFTYNENGESTSFDRKFHFLLLKTVTTVIMSGFWRFPGVRGTIDS